MKNRTLIFIFALVCVVSSLLGYALYPDGEVESLPRIGKGEKAGSRSQISSKNNMKSVWIRFQESDDSLQWLQLLAGVEKASMDELAQLAILASGNKKALDIIGRYWAEKDPDHLYQTLLAKSKNGDFYEEKFPVDNLGWILFWVWPEKDVDAAVAALSSAGGLPAKSHYQQEVHTYVMKHDPEAGFKLLSKWDHHRQPIMSREAIKKWAEKDPQTVLKTLLASPAELYDLPYNIVIVSRMLADRDPAGALESISQQPGPMTAFSQEEIIKQWGKQDFDAAADWAAEQEDGDTHSRLTAALIEIWGHKDLDEARSWTRENLEGRALNHSLAALVNNRVNVKKDINSAVSLLSEMTPSKKRTEAGITVGKAWFNKELGSKGAVSSDLMEWYEKLDDAKIQRKIMSQISWEWANKDREGLMNFLGESEAPFLRSENNGTFYAIWEIVKNDPQGAMEWATQLSSDRSLGLAQETFGAWSELQPKAALKWRESYAKAHPGAPPLHVTRSRRGRPIEN